MPVAVLNTGWVVAVCVWIGGVCLSYTSVMTPNFRAIWGPYWSTSDKPLVPGSDQWEIAFHINTCFTFVFPKFPWDINIRIITVIARYIILARGSVFPSKSGARQGEILSASVFPLFDNYQEFFYLLTESRTFLGLSRLIVTRDTLRSGPDIVDNYTRYNGLLCLWLYKNKCWLSWNEYKQWYYNLD